MRMLQRQNTKRVIAKRMETSETNNLREKLISTDIVINVPSNSATEVIEVTEDSVTAVTSVT